YGYIDNVKFETFSNCPRPEGIALSTISDVGATISWQAGNTAEAWDVVYVAQYADPSVGVPVRIENNEYQITTMNSNTHYDVYVRSVCEDGSVSNWSLPVSFRTNCHLYEAPFNETFDAFAFPPICWERYTGLASHIFAGEDFSTAPGIQWERIVLPNGLPTPHAMVQVFTSYCDAWLVSPPIDLSNVENPMLNFNLALTQHGNGNPIADVLNGADDKFMVAILGENDQHWSRAHSYVWDNTGNGNFVYNEIANEGEYISIPLSQYGSQVRVAFYAESTSQNANTDIHIDDIYVGEHVGCVYASVPVLINSASNAVTVSWLRGFEEEKWQLVCGASGVDIDTLTPITLQDTSYTITGLNPNTFYDIYIRSICTSNDTSRWSGRLKVLTAQANIAELPYSCNFENATENANWILVNDTLINKWVFGQAVETVDGGTHSLYVSDDNGVTNTYDISSSSRIWAYRDFNFDEGLEYELSFDYKLKGEVFVNVYNQEIWYDYLSVYVGNPAQTIASAFPFSIPEGAVIVTKLANTLEWRRASITLPGDFTGTTKRIYFAWENNHYDGENPPAAIDNISLKPVFCRKPQSVIASNITAYEATITIENIFDESDWEIRYAPAGSLLDTIPGILVANSQSYNITGLTPDTEYEVYVRNICSDIDTSVWKTPIVFR
ncbi:MAG: fibronectin type III domain-containing protein, partial [Bacteroidales bacterium]